MLMKLDECKGVMFDFYITLFCFLSWYPIIDEQSLSILYIAVIIKFSVIEFIKENKLPIFIKNIPKCQGLIYAKNQPTTPCWIKLTLDKNQAKTQ